MFIDFLFICGWKGWGVGYWRGSEWRDGQCICTCNFEARSNNRCCASAVSTRYSDFVFIALVIQDAKRLRRIAFSSATFPAVQYFSTLSHKQHDFRKNVPEYEMFVLTFLTNVPQIFSILRRTERYIIINVHGSLCKVSFILVRFQWNLNFLDRYRKNEIIFYENPSSGSRIVPCGQTCMTQLIVAFRNFANPLKKVTHLLWRENTLCILDRGTRTAAVQRHYDVKNTR